MAVSFWLLAPYITALAALELAAGRQFATAVLGIALTATSVVVMPVLGAAKHRLGGRLRSAATAGEGTQNRAPSSPRQITGKIDGQSTPW